MVTTEELKRRIQAFAEQLHSEMGGRFGPRRGMLA